MPRAESEASHAGEYDRIITNREPEQAIEEFVSLIRAEEGMSVPFQETQPGGGIDISDRLAGKLLGPMREELIALVNSRVHAVMQRDLDRLMMETFHNYNKGQK